MWNKTKLVYFPFICKPIHIFEVSLQRKANPWSMYSVCTKALFVFSVFEQISLLGFQWAVQHLHQYSRHNSHGCTNIWCFRACPWCAVMEICISSGLIAVSRSLSPIRWCLKAMLSSPWDGSGTWVRNVNWGFSQQHFEKRNGGAAAGVGIVWEAAVLSTLHALSMIQCVIAHQAHSWSTPQEGCERHSWALWPWKLKLGKCWCSCQAGT